MKHTRLRTLALLVTLALVCAVPVANVAEGALTPVAEHVMVLATSGRWSVQRLDANGIPTQYYSRLGAAYYNPVYISVLALQEWQLLSGQRDNDVFIRHYATLASRGSTDSSARAAHFLVLADWLVSHRTSRVSGGERFSVWEYQFPWPLYRLQPPWVSGMAQGVGIQVLVRAWRLTHDAKYRIAAIEASKAFEVPVADGGVTYKDLPDAWWYEEYAAPGALQSRVLNGMEHSLLGIQDLVTIGEYPAAQPLFDRGLRSLESNLWRFDLHWWTLYDSRGLIANRKYQLVNVGLTQALADRTGSPVLEAAATRWARYDMPFFEREFLRQPPNYVDIVILGLSALTVAATGLMLWLGIRLVRPLVWDPHRAVSSSPLNIV